jgi:Zn-dependent protease
MRGAFPLFRVAGVQVFLHFSWFIVAALELTQFGRRYHVPLWAVFEYLSLFAIVLLHEFGHALACRQVGGEADRIILWPLGGVAFIKPPPRPGAYLWSVAAGPLVNVVLMVALTVVMLAAKQWHWRATSPDLYRFVWSLWFLNCGLLIFNLLPIYPLDGGQLLRGLLWLRIGPIRSLKISSVIGFAGAIAFGVWAFSRCSIWLGVLAFFLFGQAQVGWRAAQAMELESDAAAHADAAKSPPPLPTERA